MKNHVFIVVGLVIVLGILVVTFVHEQPLVIEPAPIDVPVVPDDQPVEPEPVPEELTSVKVFFGNTTLDASTESCDQVYSVVREIEPTVAVAKEALDQLLVGVTETEAGAGFFTSINQQARVESLVVTDGTATVVFNQDFATGMAGSCKVTAVRAQIEQTLKQFSTIEAVVIKITGVPDEEVLQP